MVGFGSSAMVRHAAHNEFRRPNAAGRIIDREQDRAGEIRTRIADEIRRRVPSTDN